VTRNPTALLTSGPRRTAVHAVAAAMALAGGCSNLDEQQRRWIFQPSKDTWGGAAAAEGMDDVWIRFESRDSGTPVKLHGLWLPADDAKAPVMLYLHGARWNVRSSAGRIRRMQSLGFSVLAIDYRGFGRSDDGLPSETSALEDARAAWEWLGREHAGTPRYLFGHSLGGAVAVQLASELQDAPAAPAGLVLEGTFTSMHDLVESFKWGWLPFGPLLTQRFDSKTRIARVKAPLLVVHGSEDRLIPPTLGKALYDSAAAAKRKKWVLVEGGSHHSANAVGQGAYREAVREVFGVGVE
jgi:alpha-beta hydrolase superfamily lysophospholipase